MQINLTDKLTALALFAALFLVFWVSPVVQVTDSKFALLLSHSLWQQRTFTFDQYQFPHSDIGVHATGVLYQLHEVNGHVYYILPQGSSVLSVPFVRAAEAFGLSPVNADGSYNENQEARLQHGLAALLMAALGALFYFTARLKLSLLLSVIVALGGALGTQIWSTASRGMWAHTWNALLWGVIAWLMLKAVAREKSPQPVVLATLLSWTYFVRPTSAIGIIAVSVYVFWYYRSVFLPYAVAGATWFALFLFWSRTHFGSFFPEYYQAGRLDFSVFGTALAGHLFSPARGLLVYVPILLFLGYMLLLSHRELPHKGLVALALTCVAAQLFSASAYPHWWGGNCYGPRFLTDLAPWFVLLAVLGLAAHSRQKWRGGEIAAVVLLLAISIFMNGRGATSWDTWRWNSVPDDINKQPERLWSWRQPPFLAGLIRPPLPANLPQLTLPARIDFTLPEATPFLWYGWSGPEPSARWSDGTQAAIIFKTDSTNNATISLNLGAFLVPGRLEEQVVEVEFNGQPITTLRLSADTMETYSFPVKLTAGTNILRLKMPQAHSPASFTLTPDEGDQRLLGVRVAWLELK